MLTIHDCTFDIRVVNWGSLTKLAEHAAYEIALALLNMSERNVLYIARTPAELAKMRRAEMANMAAKRGRQLPQGCDIIVEVVSCPKG